MRRFKRAISLGFFVLLFLNTSLFSSETPPAQQTNRDRFILWAGGLTLGALLVDRSVHEEITLRDNNIFNKVLGDGRYGRPGTIVEMMGEPYSTLGVSAAFYGVGTWIEDTHAKRVGRAGVTATLVTGVATLALKSLIGRNRPYSGNDPDEYRPFNTSTAGTSFPSGHASISFAMASVIADEYDDWRVDTLSYGTASAVALSRIYQDRHWLSDVVGGTALGIGIGKWARRRDLKKRSSHVFFDGRKIYLSQKF